MCQVCPRDALSTVYWNENERRWECACCRLQGSLFESSQKTYGIAQGVLSRLRKAERP
jgi:hypothetical protein